MCAAAVKHGSAVSALWPSTKSQSARVGCVLGGLGCSSLRPLGSPDLTPYTASRLNPRSVFHSHSQSLQLETKGGESWQVQGHWSSWAHERPRVLLSAEACEHPKVQEPDPWWVLHLPFEPVADIDGLALDSEMLTDA